jgi:hypothetical protein
VSGQRFVSEPVRLGWKKSSAGMNIVAYLEMAKKNLLGLFGVNIPAHFRKLDHVQQ